MFGNMAVGTGRATRAERRNRKSGTIIRTAKNGHNYVSSCNILKYTCMIISIFRLNLHHHQLPLRWKAWEQPSICVRLRTCHCLFWEEQDVEKEEDADDVVFSTRFFNDWILKFWENCILSSHRWIKSYFIEIEMCGLFIYIVNNSILYKFKGNIILW